MYEALTALLPKLDQDHYAKRMAELKGKGTGEQPFFFGGISYDPVVYEWIDALYRCEELHLLRDYREILENSDIAWGQQGMQEADVSASDGRTVLALMIGITRAERTNEGVLLGFFNKGCVNRWLERRKELDEGSGR